MSWVEVAPTGLLALVLSVSLLGCAEEPAPDPAAAALAWCIGRADHKPVKLVGGARTMMALFDDGTVYCWGDNYTSQCDASSLSLLLQAPVQVANLPCLTEVAVSSTALGVLRDGRAIAWAGTPTPAPGEGHRSAQVRTVPLTAVSSVYSMNAFLAAIADGKAYWWGTSFPDHADAPTEVVLDGAAERLSGSQGTSCYIYGGGSLACRGRSQNGLLGPGAADSAQPVGIDGAGPAIELFVDAGLACALRADGEILCWGRNSSGGLGRGEDATPIYNPIPTAIHEEGPFVGVVGEGYGACAWRRSGEVLCWGSNAAGRYAADFGARGGPPRRVPHLEPARQVAIIDERVCALGFDDQVRCHVKNLDPDAEPTAEVLEFPPPLTPQEQTDVASR